MVLWREREEVFAPLGKEREKMLISHFLTGATGCFGALGVCSLSSADSSTGTDITAERERESPKGRPQKIRRSFWLLLLSCLFAKAVCVCVASVLLRHADITELRTERKRNREEIGRNPGILLQTDRENNRGCRKKKGF